MGAVVEDTSSIDEHIPNTDRELMSVVEGRLVHNDIRIDPEPFPVAGPAESVRGHDRASLVSKGNRPDTCLGCFLDQRVAGETGQPFRAFLLQNLNDVFDAIHVGVIPFLLAERFCYSVFECIQVLQRIASLPILNLSGVGAGDSDGGFKF